MQIETVIKMSLSDSSPIKC